MTKQNEVQQFIDEAMRVLGLSNQQDVATLLNITPQGLYKQRRAGRVPRKWRMVLDTAKKVRRRKKNITRKNGLPENVTPLVFADGADKSTDETLEVIRENFLFGQNTDENSPTPASPHLDDETGLEVPQDGSTKVLFMGAINAAMSFAPDRVPNGIVYGGDLVQARHAEDFVNVPRIQPFLNAKGLPVPGDDAPPVAIRRSTAERTARDWRKLAWLEVQGDDLAPEVRRGDEVMIDMGQTHPVPGSMYAVAFSGALVVLRVAARPEGLCLIGDAKSEPLRVDAKGVRLFGRVVRRCSSY